MSDRFPDKLYAWVEVETNLTDPSEEYIVTARDPKEFATLGETKRIAVYTLHHIVEVKGTVEVREV